MKHETPPPPPVSANQPALPIVQAKFNPGSIVSTPGALEAMRQHNCQPLSLLQRHLCGDWGDLCADDQTRNDQALIDGSRIFSSYVIAPKVTLWVITEACNEAPPITRMSQREYTTFLLPSEY